MEATPDVMKNASLSYHKKQKEWLYHFMCLLFANAKPHLSLINYGGDRPVEVQRECTAMAKWRGGIVSDDAVGAAPQEVLCCKTLNTLRSDLIL